MAIPIHSKQAMLILLLIFIHCAVFACATDSYRANINQHPYVNEWSTAKFVVNNGAYDVFVPTKTSAEWSAFRSHLPTNVKLATNTTTGCACWSPDHYYCTDCTSPCSNGYASYSIWVTAWSSCTGGYTWTMDCPSGDGSPRYGSQCMLCNYLCYD